MNLIIKLTVTETAEDVFIYIYIYTKYFSVPRFTYMKKFIGHVLLP